MPPKTEIWASQVLNTYIQLNLNKKDSRQVRDLNLELQAMESMKSYKIRVANKNI